ncbi:UPF0271 protein [Saliniradius amylolyticus]|uniref:UPF0271 protein n=1 Tax=Saliniradius amylolyticus TaxID=2183582 RepID=A0A2S2E653_9ALTE|nr:5-oxoprolinase subunit PxpA [Saliniradius amylolyticus]AWL13113.1 UPF0271 protein [Saliniradius amylolyticus]
MKLNCDLGEGFGSWKMGLDDQVMPYIDQANIACGFHAGDPDVMAHTLAMAVEHGVEIGAHPGYPDMQGFGRRSIPMTTDQIIHCLHYQVGALGALAAAQGARLSYVKPHGALYNDMIKDDAICDAVFAALACYPQPLTLMMLATGDATHYRNKAEQYGIELYLEAFADRRYTEHGYLTPRSEEGAVLDDEQTLEQVQSLFSKGVVVAADGSELPLNADTLCVHGDNPHAVAMVKRIRELLSSL